MQGVSINLFVKKAQVVKQKIYYYDVYGQRAEKYTFLAQNDLNSIEWLEIAPREPFYLLIPQETLLLEEYEQGFSVQEMFQISSVGIATGKDRIFIANNTESLKEQVLKYCNEFNEQCVKDIHYRPFDIRKVYYDTKKLERARENTFKHMLPPPPPTNPKTPNQTRKNVALITSRRFCQSQKSGVGFVSNKISDLRTWTCPGMEGGDYVNPLYYNPNYTENFTLEFRSFIDKHYNHSFEPLEVLGYIYALLYSPNYRKRYEEFLKADYPKILFTKNKDLFRALSLLGIELIGLHVLSQESLNYSFEKLDATIGESYYKEAHERNPIIKKPSHNEPEKRLYINHSAYFRGVSQEIYDYRIGGYCVLDKYLKSHKNEPCDFDHVTNIIKVIVRTIEIQKTLGFLTSDLPHLKGNDSQALMQEILQNPPPPPFNTNIALILSRQAKAIGELDFDGAFISKEASDNNIYRRGGGSAFPLFCLV